MIGRICTLLVVVAAAWAAANWPTVRTAWRYRHELKTAGEAGTALSDLGVL